MNEQMNNSGSTNQEHPRKHGFYSNALNEHQRAVYERALAMEGIDDEIALLRTIIEWLSEQIAGNAAIIVRSILAMGRMINIKNTVFKGDNMDQIRESMQQMLDQLPPDVRPLALKHGLGMD